MAIIAADSVHANHGLQRVGRDSPRLHDPQKVLDFSPHGKFVIALSDMARNSESVQFSRGLTFQKYHLSK
jgi:hypothetical protein